MPSRNSRIYSTNSCSLIQANESRRRRRWKIGTSGWRLVLYLGMSKFYPGRQPFALAQMLFMQGKTSGSEQRTPRPAGRGRSKRTNPRGRARAKCSCQHPSANGVVCCHGQHAPACSHAAATCSTPSSPVPTTSHQSLRTANELLFDSTTAHDESADAATQHALQQQCRSSTRRNRESESVCSAKRVCLPTRYNGAARYEAGDYGHASSVAVATGQ